MDSSRYVNGSDKIGVALVAILADEVRVAGAGHVYAAPEGTTIPGTLDALTDPFVDVGYVTTDGVTFTFSRESEDLDSWQADKIRVLSSREPATVAFALMQTNSDVIVLSLGGGAFTDEGGGLFKYQPVSGENLVRVLVVEFTDGGKTFRYCVPRAQVEGDVTWTLTRTGAVTYPLTFGLLDASPAKYHILSNDPAMGDGSLPGTVGGAEEAASATVAASAPSGTAFGVDSLWIDTTATNAISIFDGAAWAASGKSLVATPVAASIGTTDPTAGGGMAGAENDVYFQNDGAQYKIWIKGAGAATDWTHNVSDVIPLT